jgi:hypothetical protein
MYWVLKSDAYCVVPHSSFERSRYRGQLRLFIEDQKETGLSLIYLKNSTAELRKKIFLQQMQTLVLKKNTL